MGSGTEGSSSEGEGAGCSYNFNKSKKLSEGDMVKNSVVYCLSLQSKQHPIKKSDLIREAMNKQSKDFQAVIRKVERALRDTFGLRLIGMKPGSEDFVGCNVLEATSFIIISKFRQRVPYAVSPQCEQMFSKDLTRAALTVILALVYMLDKSVDEDTIWNALEAVDFTEKLVKKREDLKRFLKTEYVDSLYLSKQETKDADQITTRYCWGFRAEQEIDKYAVLKFVSELSNKSPKDFHSHFAKLSTEEIETIEEEDERMKDSITGDTSPDDM